MRVDGWPETGALTVRIGFWARLCYSQNCWNSVEEYWQLFWPRPVDHEGLGLMIYDQGPIGAGFHKGLGA